MKVKATARAAAETLRGFGRELGEIIVPLACAGCGNYGTALCDDCWLEWQVGAIRAEHLIPAFGRRSQIPLWAAAPYDGAVRQTIVGIKDRGDRKSTRLNSSHVAISYAVFCLKK